MKFWIPGDDTIYLFQILKAASLLDDYAQIRQVIKSGLVSVNEQVTTEQRTELKVGDTVRFKEHHIKIIESDPPKASQSEDTYDTRDKEIKRSDKGVLHGKVKKWETKQLKPEIEIEKGLKKTSRKLHNILININKTISFAESCTGGMIQEIITSYSGSSNYFLGGIVSYSNKAKIKLLKVKSGTLEKYGAVSKETAVEMVKGVRDLFNSDYAGAVTGIAGPTGGSGDKPVGTVFIAISITDKIIHNAYNFTGDRDMIRKKAALEMLNLVLTNIQN